MKRYDKMLILKSDVGDNTMVKYISFLVMLCSMGSIFSADQAGATMTSQAQSQQAVDQANKALTEQKAAVTDKTAMPAEPTTQVQPQPTVPQTEITETTAEEIIEPEMDDKEMEEFRKALEQYVDSLPAEEGDINIE